MDVSKEDEQFKTAADGKLLSQEVESLDHERSYPATATVMFNKTEGDVMQPASYHLTLTVQLRNLILNTFTFTGKAEADFAGKYEGAGLNLCETFSGHVCTNNLAKLLEFTTEFTLTLTSKSKVTLPPNSVPIPNPIDLHVTFNGPRHHCLGTFTGSGSGAFAGPGIGIPDGTYKGPGKWSDPIPLHP